MKDDERRFLVDVYRRCKRDVKIPPGTYNIVSAYLNGQLEGTSILPRDLINEDGFYMHHKRAWYLLGKWTDKGWYDYGVTLDLGWLTPEGKQKAASIEQEASP